MPSRTFGHPLAPRPARRVALARAGALALSLSLALGVALGGTVAAEAAEAGNPVTPGDFTGYGFDQCEAPSQAKMDTWWLTSPYAAAGIYISGDSRACQAQTNLTPTWVSKQLSAGWRLLPITLGPQASCTTRERYLKQVRISASTTGTFAKARSQGKAEADEAIAAATRLGIPAKSTLWYDLEAFNTANTNCRESATWFLSAWTDQLRQRGYVSGVYSSAASGIRMLDDARVKRPGTFTLPDHLWIADWNGKADVYSTYLRNDGWMPHKRVHQYRGGHDETYGGVTINIDNNWLDLGQGSTPAAEGTQCSGQAGISLTSYPTVRPGSTATTTVKALQCLLAGKKLYTGPIHGTYDAATQAAAVAWKRQARLSNANTTFGAGSWMTLLSAGSAPVVKYGSVGTAVRRLQRTLNASGVSKLTVTGAFNQATMKAVKDYQAEMRMKTYGVATPYTWAALQSGSY